MVEVMFRARGYIAASGLVWFVEAFLFSYFLLFAPWQVVTLALFYAALFAVTVRSLRPASECTFGQDSSLSVWRKTSLLPMVVVTLGSFIALPVVLAIVVAGNIV